MHSGDGLKDVSITGDVLSPLAPQYVEPAISDAIALEKRIRACYDACAIRLDAWRLQEAIDRLAEDLERLRVSANKKIWKRAAMRARDHPVHARLRQDPYLWGAFSKPRGYPGDAETLDFVYGYRVAEPSVTTLGRQLLKISTNVPIAVAVRARRDHIAEVILQTTMRVPDARIVSVACGHMRELDLVNPSVSAAASITAIDHDEVTLAALTQFYPELRLHRVCASVKDIIARKLVLSDADLIYAAGLYDYLPDAMAVQLTAVLTQALRPNGMLLILNLTPENTERGCMEAVWDWWMNYRDAAAIRKIADAAKTRPGVTARVFEIANRRVSCLSLEMNEKSLRQA